MTSQEIAALECLEIEVTQDDIENGCRRTASMCPIARAIKRKVGDGHAGFVAVSSKQYGDVRIRFWDDDSFMPGGVICFRHSPESGDFVSSFDGDLPVQPSKFELSRDRERERLYQSLPTSGGAPSDSATD